MHDLLNNPMLEIDVIWATQGSKMFGLDNSESDTDYLRVYMPSLNDCFQDQIQASIVESSDEKNTSEDADKTSWSIQKFIKMLTEQQPLALDLLFTPDYHILKTDPIWDLIKAYKPKLLTKDVQSLFSIAESQVNKYLLKGERVKLVETVKQTADVLIREHGEATKLRDVMDHFVTTSPYMEVQPAGNSNEQVVLVVCGRQFQESIKLSYFAEQLQMILDGYGKRAKQAAEAGGIDWKAVSHGFRNLYALQAWMEDPSGFVYPLPETDFLRKMKFGEFDLTKDEIVEKLDAEVARMHALLQKSDFKPTLTDEFKEDFRALVTSAYLSYL